MEMIAMLNGFPRTQEDYLREGLAQTISSNVYARLNGVPMSPEQAMLAARSNTIVDNRYYALGAAPVTAREYAIEAGVNNVTSGAMWARNRGATLAGLGAEPKSSAMSPLLLALGMFAAFAGIGYVFMGEGKKA